MLVLCYPVNFNSLDTNECRLGDDAQQQRAFRHILNATMTKDNEQYAYFTVVGEFDPETITEKLGIRPSESWQKGTRNERTHSERKFSRWSLDSRLDKSAALEEHVRDVLDQTRGHAVEIRDIGEQFECWVQLVGYFHNDYPGFGLDRDLISGLALLNVSIDCDFYYLYSHEREDSE